MSLADPVPLSEPFPLSELPLIDLTVRMFTEPKLVGDRPLLQQIADDEALRKNERLYELGVGERDLASADKFAAILEREGVEVGMKPGKLKPIPALSKTDQFMQEILNHDDEKIRALAEARLDVKSTLNETRSTRLGGMAGRGPLAVYLHYCGAHTRRWSGGDGVNFQNLNRRSRLRDAIQAPEGFLLACPDQSQGECRILNWLAGQSEVVERFKKGEDPYLPMASLIYGEKVSDPKDPRRQAGKVAELQLGFGSGWLKFQSSAKRWGVVLDSGQARNAVNMYRASHDKVVGLWTEANQVLLALVGSSSLSQWRIFKIKHGYIYHPNGTWLDYRGLRWEGGEWRLYGRHGSWSKMYGAKLVENIVQWLSRIVTAEAMVKFHQAGYPVVGMAHDDVWLLVEKREDVSLPGYDKHIITKIMSMPPSWAPGLPLAADCKIGETYGG